MLIDCETCSVRNIACGDCVVGVLLGPAGDGATLDQAERSAIGVLARSGLVPPLRLVQDRAKRPGQGASSGSVEQSAPTAASA